MKFLEIVIMMKIQQMDNNLDKYCYIQLTGLTTYEFLDILNYKLLKYKTYQKTVIIRYVDLIKAMRNGEATIRTTIEFAPLLLQYLREKKIQYSTFKMIYMKKMKKAKRKIIGNGLVIVIEIKASG